MNHTGIVVITAAQTAELLPHIDIIETLRDAFAGLARGDVVQPNQKVVLLPDHKGDFINYFAADMSAGVLGTKISPYITTDNKPIITAWTLLLSAKTGTPLMLCDASLLTTERTAATTALAIELLAPESASTLTLIGTGDVGIAHLRHVLNIRQWKNIRIFSRSCTLKAEDISKKLGIQPEIVTVSADIKSALRDTDVLMLCTSSATPVIDPKHLTKPCLITSISTNAPGAHEIPPEFLSSMDVYCDYRRTTPGQAGEMLNASSEHGWDAENIKGDLPELVTGTCSKPDYTRPVFFRSLGLGLEDIAIANKLMNQFYAQDK